MPVLEWVNVAMLRLDQQVGRPVLLEFFDVCRSELAPHAALPARLARTLHARRACGSSGIHCGAYPPSPGPAFVREEVGRLGLEYAVGLDVEYRAWKQFDVPGWPARYLFDQRLRLFEYHHGEGDYAGTERAIGELLGLAVEPVPRVARRGRPRRRARRARRASSAGA